MGRSARSNSNIKIRQPLSKVFYALEDDKVAVFFQENEEIILDELNVKTMERITESDKLISYNIKPNLRTLGQKYGKGLAEIKELLAKGDMNQMVNKLQQEDQITLENNK